MSKIIYGIIYKFPLIYIIYAMLLIALLWSYLRCVSRKSLRRNIIWKCGNALIFLGILVIVIRITLYTRRSGATEVILFPLHSFVEAKTQPEMYRSLLMNVFLFFPIGLSMPNVLPKKWKHSVLVTIIFAFIFSTGVEFLQYYYLLGRAEVDDVLCNTFGCMLGSISYKIETIFLGKQSLQQK